MDWQPVSHTVHMSTSLQRALTASAQEKEVLGRPSCFLIHSSSPVRRHARPRAPVRDGRPAAAHHALMHIVGAHRYGRTSTPRDLFEDFCGDLERSE